MPSTTNGRHEATARNDEGSVGQNGTPAADVGGRVRGRVKRELNVQKDRMTAKLDDLAETVRRVGEPLRGAAYGQLGEYADDAAGRLHRIASELRRRPIDQLAEDVGDLARRRPGVFVGVGFAAGLLAARFLKSSSEEQESAGRTNEAGESGRRGRSRQGRG